jgi:ABC-type glycerol-3-phosphate transport system permease component
MKTRGFPLAKVLRISALCVLTLVIIFPLMVTLFTSLKPAGEVITAEPTLLPSHITFHNYVALFQVRSFPRYLANSALVGGLTSLITLIIASLAAFALVWLKFPGKRVIGRSILFTYMFPQILLVIPLFYICFRLNLIDNKLGLVFTYLAISLPFGTWLLKSYFESISDNLIESALLDGCSYLRSLFSIVIPISIPGVAVVGILSFIQGWSEYLFASTLLTTDANRTIALGLQTLLGFNRVDYALFTAAGVVMVLPVVILYISIQKYLMGNLAIGNSRTQE